tara:strand:- start:667 stop:828 length:162 start_codon:yes stop_codon:yes gene_type:complete
MSVSIVFCVISSLVIDSLLMVSLSLGDYLHGFISCDVVMFCKPLDGQEVIEEL